MSDPISISVILCTYNPKEAYLERTLDSLRQQTLSAAWEFVIVDNGSKKPVAEHVSLDWHPRARIVREMEPGLTAARLRGIRETSGEVLVFIDDDNVLAPDFLENARAFGQAHPYVGAWGGSSEGVYETPPPRWAGPYLCYLAIREVPREVWSNQFDYNVVPFGAGLCLRRSVAEAYARDVDGNPTRKLLDRRGDLLTSGGDSDMAFTAMSLGLGIGLSPKLRLQHLIPPGRLELSYLERLMEGVASSALVVLHLHGVKVSRARQSRISRLFARYTMWRQPPPVRRLEAARERGIEKAHLQLAER